MADITYVAIATGFVYLAAILDAWSRRVVGYAISRSIDARLAVAALKAAISTRNPPRGCVHHSDRGSQYASEDYRAVLREHGLRGSMGIGRGNPYDNAKAERFVKTALPPGEQARPQIATDLRQRRSVLFKPTPANCYPGGPQRYSGLVLTVNLSLRAGLSAMAMTFQTRIAGPGFRRANSQWCLARRPTKRRTPVKE